MIIPEETIINVVSNYFGFTRKDLRSKSRKKELVKVRHIAIYFCRINTELTMDRIAELFCHKDHNSVVHAVKTVTNQCKSYLAYRKEIQYIENLIGGKDDNYCDIFQGNDF